MQARLWAMSYGQWFINYYLCAGKIVYKRFDPYNGTASGRPLFIKLHYHGGFISI